jgi:hypothetical protein
VVRTGVLAGWLAGSLLGILDALHVASATGDWIRILLDDRLQRPLWLLRHAGLRWAAMVLLVLLAGAAAWSPHVRRPILRVAVVIAAGIGVFAGFGMALAAHALGGRAALAVHATALVAASAALRWPRRRLLIKRAAPLLVACDVLLLVGSWWLHVRAAAARTRSGDRYAAVRAYNVLVVGREPTLVFTDQARIWRIAAPYGEGAPSPELLPINAKGLPERLIPSVDPDRPYIAFSAGGAARLTVGDATLTRFQDERASHAAFIAEDPVAKRLLVLNEWDGRAVAFRTDGAAPPALFHLFDAAWPVPSLCVDAAARRGYATSALLDGSLAVIDLDSLTVLERVPNLYLYSTVLDPDRRLLWGVRALPGELVALDPATLKIQKRIALQPGTRGLVLDPRRGQLWVSSYPFGDLFRVDAASARVLEVGSCGWGCRGISLDAAHDTLWAASQEGIFRFPLDRPIAGP